MKFAAHRVRSEAAADLEAVQARRAEEARRAAEGGARLPIGEVAPLELASKALRRVTRVSDPPRALIAGFIDDSISSGAEAVAGSIVLVPIRFAAGQTAANVINQLLKRKDIASFAVRMFNPVTARVRGARFGCGVFIKE